MCNFEGRGGQRSRGGAGKPAVLQAGAGCGGRRNRGGEGGDSGEGAGNGAEAAIPGHPPPLAKRCCLSRTSMPARPRAWR